MCDSVALKVTWLHLMLAEPSTHTTSHHCYNRIVTCSMRRVISMYLNKDVLFERLLALLKRFSFHALHLTSLLIILPSDTNHLQPRTSQLFLAYVSVFVTRPGSTTAASWCGKHESFLRFLEWISSQQESTKPSPLSSNALIIHSLSTGHKRHSREIVFVPRRFKSATRSRYLLSSLTRLHSEQH